MTSDEYCGRLRMAPVRSLNCLPQVRQRKRLYPWAVRSVRSDTAAVFTLNAPHPGSPSYKGWLHSQLSSSRPGLLARALTEPCLAPS